MSVAELRELFFLDTNIFVYSFDTTASQKKELAQQLLHHALKNQLGLISIQVAQEFLNLALRRFIQPMSADEARKYLYTVLLTLMQHHPTAAFYDRALAVQSETGYAWYDTLIVTAAIELKCTTLLSEDMQDGRTVHGVKIVNPFARME